MTKRQEKILGNFYVETKIFLIGFVTPWIYGTIAKPITELRSQSEFVHVHVHVLYVLV